jgi:hypothetical protein
MQRYQRRLQCADVRPFVAVDTEDGATLRLKHVPTVDRQTISHLKTD